jgi:hypothetical protein
MRGEHPRWIRVLNRRVNPAVASVLKSPRWHRLLSRHVALLEIEPRSGAPAFAIPVIYRTVGADRLEITVGAAAAKRWWRNFRSSWPLLVWVEGRRCAATGVVVERGEKVHVVVHMDAVPAASAAHAAQRHGESAPMVEGRV